jgi:hypothetical protein
MIIAQSKQRFLLSWSILLFGLVLLIMVGANLQYKTVAQSPVGTFIGFTIILVFFFLLPIYSIVVSRELSIDKKALRIRTLPSKQEKSYDLRNLVWWEVKPTPSRYMTGRSLSLGFVDQAKIQRNIQLTEMEFSNFDAIVAYFNSEFKRLKKKQKT